MVGSVLAMMMLMNVVAESKLRSKQVAEIFSKYEKFRAGVRSVAIVHELKRPATPTTGN
jgi:hypothetical protein